MNFASFLIVTISSYLTKVFCENFLYYSSGATSPNVNVYCALACFSAARFIIIIIFSKYNWLRFSVRASGRRCLNSGLRCSGGSRRRRAKGRAGRRRCRG